MRCCCKVLLVVALAGAAVTVEAQGHGRRHSRRGDGNPSDDVSRQMQRADGLIQMFDSNRDGVIEPNEVHGQGRYVYERLAKQAGLDPTHSVSVGELRTAVERYFKKLSEARSKSAGSKAAAGGASGRDPSKEGKSGSGKESAPKVAGFGGPAETPKVAGFGQPASGGAAAAASGSSHYGSSSGSPAASSSGSKPSPELDKRVQRYAESLLRRYDANKNGVLEKDEWSKMRNSPEKADRNHDSVVTSEELTVWLSDYGRKSSSSWSGSSSSSSVSSTPSRSTSAYHSHSRSSSNSGEKKTYRFLTPTERLPKGLPDWFARKDANGDGQVSMAEFHSGDWDAAKVAEFAGYDRNNDGMITPAECLAGKSE